MKLEHRLDQISTTIQELRRASADGPKSRQLIDALFRTIHTFKAATAAEGLTQLSRTAHQFEDLLHAVRTGKIALDDEVLHVFDETVIALRDGTQTSTLNSLNEATTHTSKGDDDLPAEFASLKQEERHRAAACAPVRRSVHRRHRPAVRVPQLRQPAEQRRCQLCDTSAHGRDTNAA